MRRLSVTMIGLGLLGLVLLGGAVPCRADVLAPGQTRTVRPPFVVPPGVARVTGIKLDTSKRTLTTPGAGAPVVPALVGVAVIIVAMASWSVLARLASARRREDETAPDDPSPPGGE